MNESSSLIKKLTESCCKVEGNSVILSEWTREGDPKLTVGVDGRLIPLFLSAHVSAYR